MWQPIDLAEGERSYRQVARAIEARIVGDELQPGAILPSETAFAAMLGVHRSTLREALRSLEQNGLVYREPGRRKLRVGRPRVVDATRRVASAMLAQEVTFAELYEAMVALEPALAGAAAKRADDAVIAALEDNLARTRQAIDDRENLTALDIEFHELVAEAGGNRAMKAAREPLGALFYPAFYPVMRRLNAAERLVAAHGHIFAAIAAGDPATSTAWMLRHIEDFQRGCILAGVEMDDPVTRVSPILPGLHQPA